MLFQGLLQPGLQPLVPPLGQRPPFRSGNGEGQGRWSGAGQVEAQGQNPQGGSDDGGKNLHVTLRDHFGASASKFTFLEANMRLEVRAR